MGFDLCQRIKATPAWSHVPVVFMTGLSDSEPILRGFASGGVDYVVKPLRIPEVMARLATHVRNARVARLAGAPKVQGAGVDLLCKLGDTVACGQVLYRVHASYPADLEFARQACLRDTGYTIGAAADVPSVFVEF